MDIRYSQPTNHIYHSWPLLSLPDAFLALSSPDKVTFSPLGPSHVSLLCDTWKFTSPQTHNMINVLIRLNRVFGLFSEDDPEPLAWMLIYRWGQSRHLRLVMKTFLQVMDQRGC